MPELQPLLESIRRGEANALSVEEVRELVAWLGGGREELTQPDHDPVLLQMVLFRLDAALFRDGQLDLRAAGVDAEVPERERKVRFRRLASVFHPDRFPQLADWLTVRSQAVHTAYAVFKKNPNEAPAPTSPSDPTQAASRSGDGTARAKRRPGALRRFLLQLRQRFGHDRNLGSKIIIGLAVLALLPVANLLLAPSARDVEPSKLPAPVDEAAIAASRSPDKPAAEPADQATAIGPGDPGRETNDPDPERSDPLIDRFGFEDNAPLNKSSLIASQTPGMDATGDETAVQQRESWPVDSALSLAARRALGGEVDMPDSGPGIEGLPTDDRLAELGLTSDNERLYALLSAGEVKRAVTAPEPRRAARSAPEPRAAGSSSQSSSESTSESTSESPPEAPSESQSGSPAQASARLSSQASSQASAQAQPRPDDATEPDPETEPTPPEPERAAPSRLASNGEPIATLRVRRSEPAIEPASDPAAEPQSSNAERAEPTTASSELDTAEATEAVSASPERTATAEPEPAQDSSTEAVAAAPAPSDDPEPPVPDAEPAVELPPSERILGPLQIHPAGRLLTRFADALEAGDAVTVQQLFSPTSVASRYRELAAGEGPRSVQLRVLRMDKDDTAWRVQTELAVFSAVDNRIDRNEIPQATFWLDTHNDTLKIVRTAP